MAPKSNPVDMLVKGAMLVGIVTMSEDIVVTISDGKGVMDAMLSTGPTAPGK